MFLGAVVRVTLPCRVCGLSMPVNHLPVDGRLRCLHCKREQAADADLVEELVHRAHDVIDLGGDARQAVEDARLVVERGEARCETCAGVLEVTVRAPGDAAARCGGCGDIAEYRAALPPGCAGLVAVIAPEHRTDRAAVKKAAGGAAVAITCPSCGGALPAVLDRRAVSCEFCKTACRIPEETWAAFEGPPREEPWYLFFDGPSRRRRTLLEEEERDSNRRRKDAAKAAQRAATPRAARGRGMSPKLLGEIAGLSTPILGFVSAALVYVTLKGRYLDDPGFAAGGTYMGLLALGLVLHGKGKIADMPPARSRVVLLVSVTGVLAAAALWLGLRGLS